MKSYRIFILLCFTLTCKFAFSQWIPSTSLLQARFDHNAATGMDGKIYVFGGMFDDVTSTSTGESLDPNTGMNWTLAPSMSINRTKFALVFGQDGYLYAIGGLVGNTSLATVERFDTRTQTWQAMANLNTPRSEHAAAVGPDGRIYVIGGYNSPFGTAPLSSVEVFNPPTSIYPQGQWVPSINLNQARLNHHAVTGLDGNIYVFDGMSGNNAEKFDGISWTTISTIPYSIGGFESIVTPNGEIYQIGVNSNPFTGGQDVYISDSNVSTFNTGADLINSRRSKGAASIGNGRVYVIGGERKNIGYFPDVEKSQNAISAKDFGISYCALWRFEENNLSPIADTKGSNNGTGINNPTHNITGKIGKSLILNGSSQFVNVNNSTSLNFGSSTNFTIEGWIKWNNPSGNNTTTIVDKRKKTLNKYQGYSVYITKQGFLGIQLANGITYQNYTGNRLVVEQNKWQHFAVSVQRSGKIKIYINSALDSEFSPLSGNINNTAKLQIAKHAFSNIYLKGELDELAIYKKALTWSEVRAIFLAGSAGKQ